MYLQKLSDNSKIPRVVFILKMERSAESASFFKLFCLPNTLSILLETLISVRLIKEINEKRNFYQTNFDSKKKSRHGKL